MPLGNASGEVKRKTKKIIAAHIFNWMSDYWEKFHFYTIIIKNNGVAILACTCQCYLHVIVAEQENCCWEKASYDVQNSCLLQSYVYITLWH